MSLDTITGRSSRIKDELRASLALTPEQEAYNAARPEALRWRDNPLEYATLSRKRYAEERRRKQELAIADLHAALNRCTYIPYWRIGDEIGCYASPAGQSREDVVTAIVERQITPVCVLYSALGERVADVSAEIAEAVFERLVEQGEQDQSVADDILDAIESMTAWPIFPVYLPSAAEDWTKRLADTRPWCPDEAREDA